MRALDGATSHPDHFNASLSGTGLFGQIDVKVHETPQVIACQRLCLVEAASGY
jgi:hypothetical protein